jgi:hypothetical protein
MSAPDFQTTLSLPARPTDEILRERIKDLQLIEAEAKGDGAGKCSNDRAAGQYVSGCRRRYLEDEDRA